MHSLQVLMQENRAARLGSRLSRTQRSASSTDYPASTDALIGTPPRLARYASFRRITAVRLPKEHRQYDAYRDENRGTDSSNPLPSREESSELRDHGMELDHTQKADCAPDVWGQPTQTGWPHRRGRPQATAVRSPKNGQQVTRSSVPLRIYFLKCKLFA